MSNPKVKSKVKSDINKPKFINKSRQDFRNELLNHAKANFSDHISDFSEMSLGGMFLDFAAIVGESLSFYVDQQINELDYETTSSDYNLINHLKKANIKSNFSSPSSVSLDFYISVSLESNTFNTPKESDLPLIKKGSTFISDEGIPFVLEEDVDFTKSYKVFQTITDASGDVVNLFLVNSGICTSGTITQESITFPESTDNDFLSYTLSNEDVTSVIKIIDNASISNEYKEVEFLTQDTIYEKIELSKHSFFEIRPAPFRFVTENDFDTGLTSIRFGNGKGKILEDGMFTNPEDLTLPLLGRNYSSNISIDPKDLLNSDSLGVSPLGKTISITYKHGGGEDHNVPARSISQISSLIITFPKGDDNITNTQQTAAASVSVINEEPSLGGTNPLGIEELRKFIPTALKKQSRIVTHEDLLARIYTMPSNFGRIHKASIIDNPYTKISKDMYVICKDNNGHYTPANDAIKVNLSKIINEYRIIGDTFNIIDAPIFNFGVFIKVKVHESFDPRDVLLNVKTSIFNKMRFETLQIGQGINVNDIIFIALSTPGVLTITSNFKTVIRAKSIDDISFVDIEYNENKFSPVENYEDGIVYPPLGGIFELKDSSDIEIINN